MKVCIVNDRFPPANPESMRILGIASALERRGHKVTLVGPGMRFASTAEAIKRNPRSLKRRSVSYYANSVGIMRTLQRTRSDIDSDVLLVQIPFPIAKGIVAVLRRMPTTKRFLDIGDYWANTSVGPYKRLLDLGTAYLLRGTDGASVASHLLLQSLMALGVSANKLLLLPNCVNLRFFDYGSTQAHSRSDGQRTVAYLGTISKLRGCDELARIAEETIRRDPRVTFIVIGTGTYLPALRAQVKDLGLQENFTFTGFVKSEEVPSYLKGARIGLCLNPPTRAITNASSPLKLTEYMAMGCVPISTNFDDAEFLIKNGINGYICEYQDMPSRIVETLSNGRELDVLRQRAIDYARTKFNWDHWIKTLVKFWTEA